MEKYSSYKDSGVKWLGEIPSHWDVISLKHLANISSGSTPSSSVEKYWNGNVRWITPADFKTETKYVSCGIRNITEEGVSACSTVVLPQNSVVFSKRAPVGQVSITTEELCVNQGCIACVPNSKVISTFLYYLLSVYRNEFDFFSVGTTFREISLKEFSSFKVSVPSILEQELIVKYLDFATSQIDTAISQQKKMIELLNERKQIIINNAVTKGLDPNVKMKDSGVDWIGEIPEGWEVRKLKHFVYITDGTHDTPRYVDPSNNTYPLVTSRCIVNGVIDLSLANHISEQDYREIATRSYVRKFDVIMPMIGTVGNPAVVDFDDCVAIKNVALFRTNGDIYKAKFLKFLLDSSIVKEQFSMYNKGGVQNFVSQDILKNLTMIVPINVSEIVDFIENEIDKLIQPISILTNQIALLQERKQIIINDVVTGKVKVS